MHVRLFNREVIEPGNRVEFYVAQFSTFAHNLFMHLAFLWHINYQITLNSGRTPQSAIFSQPAFFIITLLGSTQTREVFSPAGNFVFGKFTHCMLDLAAPAYTAATANRIKINTQITRRCQNRRANSKVAALARWGKNHQSINGIAGAVHGLSRPTATAAFAPPTLGSGVHHSGFAEFLNPSRTIGINPVQNIGRHSPRHVFGMQRVHNC